MATICIFGDSITWGASDSESGGWVARLKNHFESAGLPVDQDVDVYNLGVSGDNTDDLLKRFAVEAEAREPSAILFAIGINDSQFVISENANRVVPEKFVSNLNELLKMAKNHTDKIGFIGLTDVDESKTVPIPWNMDKTYTAENRDKYNSLLCDFCESNSLPYLDMSKVVSIEELPDGLHPDNSGHEQMFDAIKTFIEKHQLT